MPDSSDRDNSRDDDDDDSYDGDEASRQLMTTLLFIFSHGNHVPAPLLERLQSSVRTTFYSSSTSASHIADHVGAVYETVREIMEHEAFAEALG